MYFQNYRVRKTWFNKCLKSPISADPSSANMVNRLKHSFNPHKSTFTIFIDHREDN